MERLLPLPVTTPTTRVVAASGAYRIDLGLRNLTPQDYNEHTSHFYTSGPRGGDEQYERSTRRESLPSRLPVARAKGVYKVVPYTVVAGLHSKL